MGLTARAFSEMNIDNAGLALLRHAQEIAGGDNKRLDVAHVLLAAIRYDWKDTSSQAYIQSLAPLYDSPSFGQLERILELDGQVAQTQGGAPGSYYTDALAQSLTRATQLYPDMQVTSVTILLAILSDEGNTTIKDFRQEALQCGVESVIMSQLKDKAEGLVVSPTQRVSTAHGITPPSVVKPDPDGAYKQRHHAFMDQLKTTLNERDAQSLIVVAGQNGTPINYIAEMLADRLADQTSALSVVMRPKGIHTVMRDDVTHYVRYAMNPSHSVDDASERLREALEHAQRSGAILVLKHLEQLRVKSSADVGGEANKIAGLRDELINQLAQSGDVMLVGLYETTRAGGENVREALDADVRVLDIGRFDPPYTLSIINDYFLEKWEHTAYFADIQRGSRGTTMGYEQLRPAFDILLALEPGIEVDQQRIAAPYAVIEVIEHLLDQARNDDGTAPARLKTYAKSALRNLQDLDKLPDKPPDDVVSHFAEPLALAKQLIEEFLRNGESSQDSFLRTDQYGRVILTRAHLVAVLFGSYRTRFRYPKHLPTWHWALEQGSGNNANTKTLRLITPDEAGPDDSNQRPKRRSS